MTRAKSSDPTAVESQPPTTKPAPQVPPTDTLAHRLGDMILEKKGRDLVILRIDRVSTLADFLVIATAANRRQVQSMALDLEAHLKSCGVARRTLEGMEQGWWVLLDGGDVIVHLMQEDARRFYDLEMLWADGQVVRRSADVA